MDTQAVIEDYVNKVAARLPRKLRNDIGVELRTLLTEQLRSLAQDTGRSPDREMAMDVLRRFGRPDVVAARYAPRGFQLIEPEYSPLFVKLATLCVAIQWGVTLPLAFSSRMTFGDWWLRWGFSALSWVGALVVYFGIGSWIQPAGADTSWALYGGNFQRWLLPPLIVLMAVRLGLLAAVALNERLRTPTEAVRFGLWVSFVALLYWAVFGWRIFAHPVTDALFKAWLLVYLLVNVIQIVVWIRRAVTRVRMPESLPPA